MGIYIASHSVSHPMLALQNKKTPIGGLYQDSPFGREQLLSENEVYFQLKESKNTLENICGQQINDFVIPFGRWNEMTLKLNKEHHLYDTFYTSDEGLDKGKGFLRPRFIIQSTISINQTLENILQLT